MKEAVIWVNIIFAILHFFVVKMVSLSDQIKATTISLQRLMPTLEKEIHAIRNKNKFIPEPDQAKNKAKIDELTEGLDKIATLYNELIRWTAWWYDDWDFIFASSSLLYLKGLPLISYALKFWHIRKITTFISLL